MHRSGVDLKARTTTNFQVVISDLVMKCEELVRKQTGLFFKYYATNRLSSMRDTDQSWKLQFLVDLLRKINAPETQA
jgi:hypothetical protein